LIQEDGKMKEGKVVKRFFASSYISYRLLQFIYYYKNFETKIYIASFI